MNFCVDDNSILLLVSGLSAILLFVVLLVCIGYFERIYRHVACLGLFHSCFLDSKIDKISVRNDLKMNSESNEIWQTHAILIAGLLGATLLCLSVLVCIACRERCFRSADVAFFF